MCESFGCNKLKSIYFPATLTEIGINAFCDFNELESIEIDANNPKFYSRGKSVYNKETDELVFELGSYKGILKKDGYISYYDKNKNATLVRYNSDNKEKFLKTPSYLYEDSAEYKVKTISGAYLFNEHLQEVEISDGVEKITTCAFSYCKNLKTVKMPDSIIKLGENAFSYCEKLKNIKFSEYIEEIGGMAFYNCVNLKMITIPDSVKIIRRHAFSGCKNLTKLVLPSNLEVIDEYAFSSCNKLKSVYIPASVKSLSGTAFKFCKKLRKFEVDPANEYYCVKRNCIVEKDTGKLVVLRESY